MKRLIPFALILCLLSSCAYMQTNKSVAEIGTHYVGAEMSLSSIELYSRAGEWYLAAPKVLLKRHYPVFYDTIYLNRDNDPTESVTRGNMDGAKLYIPISAGTAASLMRSDGYAELPSLLAECNSDKNKAYLALPNARRHEIKAQIESQGKEAVYYVLERVPEQPATAVKCLSVLDKYTVDAIGTLVYNVAIPIMAPFRFFAEFITSD